MSLRTKLLAAVVGLNGAILLLALYLILQGESGTPASAVAEVAAFGYRGNDREAVRTRVDALEPQFRGLWLVEEAGVGSERTIRVWRARDYFLESPPDPLPVDDETRRVIVAYENARRNEPVHAGRRHLAVVLPEIEEDTHWGVVAAPREALSGARDAYVVMLGGVLLLTGVSFWLVSRLVVSPLARLTAAAERMAEGDYRIRLEAGGTNDEFDRTLAAFNRMAREIGEYQGHLEDRVLQALGRIKKAEQHLVIAQRLAATGKLASGIAHEINNPLGGMKNAVRALARGDLSRPKTKEYLDLIADGLTRVEETVKKFLSFTPRRVEPRPSDLGEVARKALALARHRIDRKSIEVKETLPPTGEATVFGDPHELQQVALNLLLNAADAIGEGQKGRIELEVARAGDEMLLRVSDDGCGMSAEDQDRCFDLFFTTKEVGEGSGLGLAVVHNIVTNHGGRIEVESALGKGSTFRIYLPVESAPEAASGAVPAALEAPERAPEPPPRRPPGAPPHDVAVREGS
jgi:signal transduction histidine kinase